MNIVAVTQSALAAGLLRHQVAAGNLANVSTPGAEPRRVDLRTAADGGVEATVHEADPPLRTYDSLGRGRQEVSGIDVADELGELVEAGHQVKLSAAVLRRATESQGTLIDVLA